MAEKPIKKVYRRSDHSEFYPETVGNAVNSVSFDTLTQQGKNLNKAVSDKIGYLTSMLETDGYYLYGFRSYNEYNMWHTYINAPYDVLRQAGLSRSDIEQLVMFKIKTGEKSISTENPNDPNNPDSPGNDEPVNPQDVIYDTPELISPNNPNYGGGGGFFTAGEKIPLRLKKAETVKEIRASIGVENVDITKYLTQVSFDNGVTWHDIGQHGYIMALYDKDGNAVYDVDGRIDSYKHPENYVRYELDDDPDWVSWFLGYNNVDSIQQDLLSGKAAYIMLRFNPSENAQKIWEYHRNDHSSDGWWETSEINVSIWWKLILLNGQTIEGNCSEINFNGVSENIYQEVEGIGPYVSHPYITPYNEARLICAGKTGTKMNNVDGQIGLIPFKYANATRVNSAELPYLTFEGNSTNNLENFYYYIEDIGVITNNRDKQTRHIGVNNKAEITPNTKVNFTAQELENGVHVCIICGLKDEYGGESYPSSDRNITYVTNYKDWIRKDKEDGSGYERVFDWTKGQYYIEYKYIGEGTRLGLKVDKGNPDRTLVYVPYNSGSFNPIPELRFTATLDQIDSILAEHPYANADGRITTQDQVIRECTFYITGKNLEYNVELFEITKDNWGRVLDDKYFKFYYQSGNTWVEYNAAAVKNLINQVGKARIKAQILYTGNEYSFPYKPDVKISAEGCPDSFDITMRYNGFGIFDNYNMDDYYVVIDDSDYGNPFLQLVVNQLYNNAPYFGLTTDANSGMFLKSELMNVCTLPEGFINHVNKLSDNSNFTTADFTTGVLKSLFPNLIEVKANAFKDCSNLNKIVLPDSVTVISNKAVVNCAPNIKIYRKINNAEVEVILNYNVDGSARL